MKWAVALIVVVVSVSSLLAGEPLADEKTGLKVGSKAPEFKLKDQAGKERTLAEFRKNGPVALVFLRSANL